MGNACGVGDSLGPGVRDLWFRVGLPASHISSHISTAVSIAACMFVCLRQDTKLERSKQALRSLVGQGSEVQIFGVDLHKLMRHIHEQKIT